MPTQDPGIVKEVFEERKKHNNNSGVDVLISGGPGCGKTNAIAKTAIKNYNKYGDIIVWRGETNCQFSMLKNASDAPNLVLWLQEGLDYNLDKDGEEVDLYEYFDEVNRWNDSLSMANNFYKDKINVIQTVPWTTADSEQFKRFCSIWEDIFQALNEREKISQHLSFFYDEFQDLAPQEGSGRIWHILETLKGEQKNFRKNHISSFYVCHKFSEVHHFLRSKIRWSIYMKGGIPDSNSNIDYEGCKKLEKGRAYIEGSDWERFKFKKTGNPDETLRAKTRVVG